MKVEFIRFHYVKNKIDKHDAFTIAEASDVSIDDLEEWAGNENEYWRESTKALALMYFMQMGTPFIYQCQEIGMTNTDYINYIKSYSQYRW
jgi:glycosidase